MEERPAEKHDKREELAALLADESDDRVAHKIDSLIARDPSLIRERTALNESWELLAFLPMPTAKEDFTARTMEFIHPRSIAATIEAPVVRNQNSSKLLTTTAWILCLGIAFALAYAGARQLPDENRNLIEQWPILQRLDEYQAVQDMEFLKLLHGSKRLDQMDKLFTPETTKK